MNNSINMIKKLGLAAVLALSAVMINPALAEEAAVEQAVDEMAAETPSSIEAAGEAVVETAEETTETVEAVVATATDVPPAIEEEPHNPYGMKALWEEGDFVSKGTLIILAIMSFGSWYIGISKFFEQSKLFKQSKEAKANFWEAPNMQAGVDTLSEDSAFRYIADSSLKAYNKHDSAGMRERVEFSEWLTMSIQKSVKLVGSRLQGGLPFLATVGSTSPFVGLFGTVWGIYHALTAIGMSGQASIDKVAGPVGEALIMTAIGLAVAVPAVLGYNWLLRRNKVVMEHVTDFASEVQMVILGSKK